MHTTRPTLPLLELETLPPTEEDKDPAPANQPVAKEPPKGGLFSRRYEDRCVIGMGGMGEIRRVYDRRLRRTVAMKILRDPFIKNKAAVRRFLEEAQVAAQLAHPNIVSVHDVGVLGDERPFFTMDEVRGRTLGRVIRELHHASPQSWAASTSGWTLRRTLEAFRQVCDAIAYAHARGVLHRDLKPDNIMLGTFGEVLVMDWGLAKLRDQDGAVEPVHLATELRGATRAGAVAGTPAYMPPEQARGEHERMDQRADVYALGAILYEILDGRAPYVGKDTLKKVLAGPPPALGPQAVGRRDHSGPPIPTALRRICARAMAREIHKRFHDANRLGRALGGWLDGSRKRASALQLVAAADELSPEVERLERAAKGLRERAEILLSSLPPQAPVEDKREAWALEERAEAMQTEAELKNVARLERLRAALNEAPDTREANQRLAAHYATRHQRAEQRRDPRAQAALEALLDAHDTGDYSAYLIGKGHMALRTDPCVPATVRPLVLEDRRLVPGPPLHRGPTPVDLECAHGSYVVELRHAGRTLRWPAHVQRLKTADATPPGAAAALTTSLPSALAEDEAWVPAGWAWIGGDNLAPGAGPRRKVWVDAFVMRTQPITHGEFLAFLQDLTARDGLDAALRWAPRLAGLPNRGIDGLRYSVASGTLHLGPDLDPDGPVTWVTWEAAGRFASWLAERTTRAWRLPTEIEWEKAARGVDGRFFPWGDHFDPSFCRVRSAHRTARAPDPVQAWPTDESVYGVRGLGGNAREWCHDAFIAEGPRIVEDRAVVDDDPWADVRAVRGGSWARDPRQARSAARDWEIPSERASDLGFRLAYPVD